MNIWIDNGMKWGSNSGAEIFTSPKSVLSTTQISTACCLLVSPPNDEIRMFFLVCGIDPSWFIKAWVIKDRLAPSSNKILA